MTKPDSRATHSGQAWSPLLHRLLALLLLGFVVADHFFKPSMDRHSFTQVDLNYCSSLKGEEKAHSCLINDTNSLSTVSVIPTETHRILYFDIVLARHFYRPYRTNYHRLEYQGRVFRNGKLEHSVFPQENSYIQGADPRWNVSNPHRVAWAKNVKVHDNITFELDFVKLFHHYKDKEASENYASSGAVKFMIVAESDSNWMVDRIYDAKTIAFWMVLPIFLFAIYKSETTQTQLYHAVRMVLVGGMFLYYTCPLSGYRMDTTPEEYLGSKHSVQTSFLTYWSLEIAMGIQIVADVYPYFGKGAVFVIPAVAFGLGANWYARTVNLEDYDVATNAYYDGNYRFPRHHQHQNLTEITKFLGPGLCLLIGLLGPLLGSPISALPVLLAYTMSSFNSERFTLARFSTWKLTRDISIWIFCYLYLVAYGFSRPNLQKVKQDHSSSGDQDEKDSIKLPK